MRPDVQKTTYTPCYAEIMGPRKKMKKSPKSAGQIRISVQNKNCKEITQKGDKTMKPETFKTIIRGFLLTVLFIVIFSADALIEYIF